MKNLSLPDEEISSLTSGIGVGDYGYLFGGQISTVYPELPYFRYDQQNNSWEEITGFKHWYSLTGFVLNGKIYLGTGQTDKVLINEFWCYNPDTNAWKEVASIPSDGNPGASAFVINGKAYIGLGDEQNNLWEFDPASMN